MVYIKKIEVKGFKSFGNRLLTLPLDEGFVAVTGPNGSGKSNLLDAVTFCLGESSPRVLRAGGRLTSLLSENSDTPGASSAKVTLHFDNTSRKIPVDSDTVTVTRELRHTGESTYYLNSKRIMKNALVDILDHALISSGGLNIIQQGMTTRIAELIPDEKRRILDELTGVAQFDDKKAEAQIQLKEADQKLQIALARIGEVKNRITTLEIERNDLLRLKQLEDEVRWLKATVTSRNLLVLRAKMKSSSEDRRQKEAEIGEVKDNLQNIRDEISKLESERSEFVSTVMGAEGGKQVELQLTIGKITSDIDRLTDQVREAENSLKNAKEALPHLRRMRDEHGTQCTNTESEVKSLVSQISALQTQQSTIEDEISSTQIQLVRGRKSLDKRNEEQDRAKQKLTDLSQQLIDYQGKIKFVTADISLNQKNLRTTTEKSSEFLSALEDLDSNIKTLEESRASENESLRSLTRSISDSEALRSKLMTELEAALKTLETAGRKLDSYESQTEIIGKIFGDDLGRTRILELSKSGVLDGIMGHLDEIIDFETKFEAPVRAISQRWNNALICKDISSMVKVIALGKKLKVNRFALIPLSEIKNSQRTIAPDQAGILGNLADYVNAPSWADGLLNFVFGDTLLVESASTAYLLSTSGKRAVTTSGDVFEPGPTSFETGYLTTINAVVDQIPTEGSLSNIRNALDSLRLSISKRKSALVQIDGDASTASKDNLVQSVSVAKVSVELSSLKQFLARYSKIRKNLQLQVTKLSLEGGRLEKRLKRFDDKEQAIKARIQNYEKKADLPYTQPLIDELRNLDTTRVTLETQLEEIAKNLRDQKTVQTEKSANLDQNLRPMFEKLGEQIQNSENEMSSGNTIKLESSERIQPLKEELSVLKKEERTRLESSKKSQPILESKDRNLTTVRRKERTLDERLQVMDKGILSLEKEQEVMREGETSLLGEITLYGYANPIEPFEGSEELLGSIAEEYEGLRNSVNNLAVENYAEIYSGYKNLSVRQNQLDAERSSIIRFIEDVESEKKSVFLTSFEKINTELGSIFAKFTGGTAWLEHEKPDDIFSGGTLLMTQFANKMPREAALVSGGEKSITAVSFLLAVHSVYPSPFYLFDEIDAHLDAVYADRLAEIFKERTSSQLIVVTLKDTMLVKASVVYGVYTTNGVSHIVKYKPDLEVKPTAV